MLIKFYLEKGSSWIKLLPEKAKLNLLLLFWVGPLLLYQWQAWKVIAENQKIEMIGLSTKSLFYLFIYCVLF